MSQISNEEDVKAVQEAQQYMTAHTHSMQKMQKM